MTLTHQQSYAEAKPPGQSIRTIVLKTPTEETPSADAVTQDVG